MRAQNRSGRAHLELKARVRRDAGHRGRIGVEEHSSLVARRIFELLHHQVPALGRGGPVNAPERLALLVVPDAVEVEAGRTAEKQAPALDRTRTGVREEAVELDEPWVDENRRSGRQVDLNSLEP